MPQQLIGQTYHFDLGALKVDYRFDSDTKATFTVRQGAGLAPDGYTETVDIALHRIRDGLYLNSWTEAGGATVTHVEDFANGVLYSNVTVDDRLHAFKGTIRKLD